VRGTDRVEQLLGGGVAAQEGVRAGAPDARGGINIGEAAVDDYAGLRSLASHDTRGVGAIPVGEQVADEHDVDVRAKERTKIADR
jgi:hypothetical protein